MSVDGPKPSLFLIPYKTWDFSLLLLALLDDLLEVHGVLLRFKVASEEENPMLRPDVPRKFDFFWLACIASFPLSLPMPASMDVTFDLFEKPVTDHRRLQFW